MVVKNKYYREFLDKGKITTLSQEELEKALNNITGRHIKMGRSLLILLFYTGCRPIEALDLHPEDFQVEGQNLIVSLKTRKRGIARDVYLPLRNHHIKELKSYALGMPPTSLIYYKYISLARHKKTKKDGTVYYLNQRSKKLHRYFRLWFKDIRDEPIPPYFLRHNTLSRLAELGHSEMELKYLKGARSVESVAPYVHLSSIKAKKLSAGIGKI